jgi:hypothetical protein
VSGGEGYVGCGYGGFWVFIVYLGMGYGSVGCKIEAVCGWGRAPYFTLEDVELVGTRSLYVGLTCFTSGVGSA